MTLRSTVAIATISGAMLLLPSVTNAGVEVSAGIGVPGLAVYAPGPGYTPYDSEYYYDPIYVDGAWYHGPYRWRMRHGERMFWLNGRWRRNEWSGRPIPGSIVFRNGGYFRGGRYEGFRDADRINARFVSPSHRMQEDRRDSMRPERRTDRPDASHMAGPGDQPHN